MEAIRIEQDRQTRTIQSQKSALDAIVSDLASLRFVGKEQEIASHAASPAPESIDVEITDNSTDAVTANLAVTTDVEDESGEIHEAENREDDRTSIDDVASTSLGRKGNQSQGGDNVEDDDIEMGELAEDPRDKGKRKREDMEEGEASDSSSDLSDPPDD